MSGAAPRVSVVMRAKNSDWVIGQALSGLFAQTFTDFELIVVDSGSTDQTLEIVSNYPHRLIEIEPQAYFPGAVLNMAIPQARGEIIVFQNSDSVPLSPYTFERLLAAFDDPAVAAAFGRQLPRPEAHGWVRRDYAASFPPTSPAPPWLKMSLVLAAIRKAVWEQRPFYTDAWASEDSEWANWAEQTGHRVAYVPDAIVMHSHNYTLKELYGRRFVEGEADAFIYNDCASAPRFAVETAKSIARDVIYHARARDFAGLAAAPVRRAVFHWAHYKGHKLGERRKAAGDRDASVGQKAVLARRVR